MSSNDRGLPNQNFDAISFGGSDAICGQRDAGGSAEAASAGQAGCLCDEVERKPDEKTGDDRAMTDPAGCRPGTAADVITEPAVQRSSETAQAGLADPFQTDISIPAEGIKSRRDFEAFLRNSGFSRSVAKSLAAGGWPSIGEPQCADDDFPVELGEEIGALIKLLREK